MHSETQNNAQNLDFHILRLPAVMARTGLSRSTIYELIARREFPHPIALGPRAVGWVEAEVINWIAERIQARQKT